MGGWIQIQCRLTYTSQAKGPQAQQYYATYIVVGIFGFKSTIRWGQLLRVKGTPRPCSLNPTLKLNSLLGMEPAVPFGRGYLHNRIQLFIKLSGELRCWWQIPDWWGYLSQEIFLTSPKVMFNFVCQLGWATVPRELVKHYSRRFCTDVFWMKLTFQLVNFE